MGSLYIHLILHILSGDFGEATPVKDTCSYQVTLLFLTCSYTPGVWGSRRGSPTVKTLTELASCTMARNYCQAKTTDAFQDQLSNKSSGYLLRQSEAWHDETAEQLLRRKPELFLLNATRSLGMVIMWWWHSFEGVPSETERCKTIRLGQRVAWQPKQSPD